MPASATPRPGKQPPSVSPIDTAPPGSPPKDTLASPPSPPSPPPITNKARAVTNPLLSTQPLADAAFVGVARLALQDKSIVTDLASSDDDEVMVLSDEDIIPEDARLVIADEQNRRIRVELAAKVAADRKQRVAAANATLQAQTPYRFHRDGYFKLSAITKFWKTKHNMVWGAAIVPRYLEPKNADRDPKSIHDIARRSVPSGFESIHDGRPWRQGTLPEFHQLAASYFNPKADLKWRNDESGQRLRDCLIGLSKMTPETFGNKLYDPATGDLLASPETLLWVAANAVLGSSWKIKTIPPQPAVLKPRVAFSENPASRQTASGTFLAGTAATICSRDSRDWQLQVTKAAPRTYRSFFTLALPAMTTSTKPEQTDEALTALHDALTLLWTCDRRLTLYVFPTKAFEAGTAKPMTTLQARACPTFSRRNLEKYVNQLYLRKDYRPYLRFYIGHQQDSVVFTGAAFRASIASRDLIFFYDDIQAPATLVCGWLLGTHKSLNLKHYSALMRSNKKFANHPVTLSMRAIRMFPEENTTGHEIRAAHVLCDATKRNPTTLLLKSQYNRRRDDDLATLPEGKLLKFIPYFANRGDRRPPPVLLHRYQMCRVRQAQFTDKHVTRPISGVMDLDLTQEIGDLGLVSLRQVALGIKTRANWQWPLFLSVDFDDYRGDITALFHKDNSTEASTLLDYLPLILEAKYGDKVWNWFTPETRGDMQPYQWNEETNCVEEAPRDADCGGTDDETGFLNFYGNSGTADWEEIKDADIAAVEATTMSFDLGNHFNMRPITGGAGYDDQLSLPSFKTATSNATAAAAAASGQAPTKQVIYDSDDSSDTTSLTGMETINSSRSAPPTAAVFTASAPQTRVSKRHDR